MQLDAFNLVIDLLSRGKSALDLSGVLDTLVYRKNWEWTNGTGADQGNQHWHDQRTLAASASENLDLAVGLTGPFGETITFTKVKLLVIYAAKGNTNDVEIGGAAANAFLGPFKDATDVLKIAPGGIQIINNPGAAGWAVTPGTGDILKAANGGAGTSVTYDIVIVGTV